MKFYAAALLAGATSASYTAMQAVELDFIDFIAKHGKSYGTRDEYEFRLAQFAETKKEVDHLNETEPYSKHGINTFADWTSEERKKYLTGFKPSSEKNPKVLEVADELTPIDWVALGHVSRVKDQGQCGSCWAFSATGAVESAMSIAGQDPIIELSEQELVDCDKGIFKNAGCSGGDMGKALEYIAKNQLTSEDKYPYDAKDEKCKSKGLPTFSKVKKYDDVVGNNVEQFKQALSIAPLSIGIEADQAVFHSYTGGIITSKKCGESIDHGVLAVGWGIDEESGLEYVNVKNSWGVSWGAKGYCKIALNASNICGMLWEPRYAEIKK